MFQTKEDKMKHRDQTDEQRPSALRKETAAWGKALLREAGAWGRAARSEAHEWGKAANKVASEFSGTKTR
jgi:hypothetical protein